MSDPLKSDHGSQLTGSQQLANRLARISYDMEEVVNYLDAHVELDRLQEGLSPGLRLAAMHACMSAAIVSYSRGFVKSISPGFADKLVPAGQFEATQAPWAADLHQRILDLRKKAVGHADWTYHATHLIERPTLTSTLRVTIIPNIYQGVRIEQFRELAKNIGSEALNQRLDLERDTS